MDGKEKLYKKVKFVDGENFVTIEDTHQLNADEVMNLADFLVADERIQKAEHLTILLNNSFPVEVAKHLEGLQFELHDENVFFRCNLNHLNEPKNRFQLRSLHEVSTEQFKQVWKKVMECSLNSSSYLNMDEQMKSVEKELGSTYKDTCNIAFEEGRIIGVVMPHIEPGTIEEGRIFYFGLVPEERGKGRSADLYLQGLYLLKERFGAVYSVGATSVKNIPMQKVFEKHNCQVTDQVKVYKRWNGGI
jgi:hypothetical protein